MAIHQVLIFAAALTVLALSLAGCNNDVGPACDKEAHAAYTAWSNKANTTSCIVKCKPQEGKKADQKCLDACDKESGMSKSCKEAWASQKACVWDKCDGEDPGSSTACACKKCDAQDFYEGSKDDPFVNPCRKTPSTPAPAPETPAPATPAPATPAPETPAPVTPAPATPPPAPSPGTQCCYGACKDEKNSKYFSIAKTQGALYTCGEACITDSDYNAKVYKRRPNLTKSEDLYVCRDAGYTRYQRTRKFGGGGQGKEITLDLYTCTKAGGCDHPGMSAGSLVV